MMWLAAVLALLLSSAEAGAATAWSPFDTSLSTTLSNNDLTVTGNPTTTNTLTRSNTSRATGKWYFEVTPGAPPGVNTGAGITNGAVTEAQFGPLAKGALYYKGTGNIWVDGANSGKSLGIATTSTVGVAMDFSASLIWFAKCPLGPNPWNATVGADPATGVGGLSFASLIVGDGDFFAAAAIHTGTVGSWTLNPNGPFTCTAPAGFVPYGGATVGVIPRVPLTRW